MRTKHVSQADFSNADESVTNAKSIINMGEHTDFTSRWHISGGLMKSDTSAKQIKFPKHTETKENQHKHFY